jgi:fructokinase
MAETAHTRDTARPLIFGEVLHDCFPDGARVLGGAPFNVAWHLQGFGLSPLLLTRIGQDVDGAAVLERMTDWGMDTRAVQHDATHPTGTVAITLHNDRHSFHIATAQAYDYIDHDSAAAALHGANIGLLYHGTLAARSTVSAATLHRLRHEQQIPTFVDINLRAPWWQLEQVRALIQGAAWAKLNDEELRQFGLPDAATAMAAQRLAAQHQIDHLIVTLGAHGALLLHDDVVYDCPAVPPGRLVDTVGAGDAFSAVMLLGLVRHWGPAQSLRRAAEFAAAICTRRGATVAEHAFYEEFSNHWED